METNMSKKQTKRSCLTLENFSGIDILSPVGTDTAYDSCNFKHMPDGSLKKRMGYRKLLSLPEPPSGFSVESRGSINTCHAVAGCRLYEIDPKSGDFYPLPGTLPFASEHTSLLQYKEMLLILNGSRVNRASSLGIQALQGYVPLYGVEWDPLVGGRINELPNLLSSRVRISYLMGQAVGNIFLPLEPLAVERVEVNGIVLSSSEFVYDLTTHVLSSSRFTSSSTVNVVLTFRDEDQDPKIASCRHGSISYSKGENVLFLYASEASGCFDGFRSTPITAGQLAESRTAIPLSTELYFPLDCRFTVGNGSKPIKSIIPLDERVIVFTDDEAWLVPSADEPPKPSLLRLGVGCSSCEASTFWGEAPVTVCKNGIYIWRPELESYNELSAVRISDKVMPLFAQCTSFAALSVPDNGELWFVLNSESKKTVLIYDHKTDRFYRYSGFSPDFIFVCDGKVGFVSGADVFLFDESSETDISESPIAVEASYLSGWLQPYPSWDAKKARSLILNADTGGEPITVFLEFDGKAPITLTFTESNVSSASVLSKSLSGNRFSGLRIGVLANGAVSQRIYGIKLIYDKLKTHSLPNERS